MSNQTQSARLMVLMFTDIVGSVDLKTRLGTAVYANLISEHDALFRDIIDSTPGAEVLQDTGDGFLARFDNTSDTVSAALRFQHALACKSWEPEPVRVRVGVHLGQVMELVRDGAERKKLVGLPADVAARIMGLAQPGQILMSRAAFDDARQYVREHPTAGESAETLELEWIAHGPYQFKGAEDPMDVCEVGARGLAPLTAPPDSEKANRAVPPGEEELFGWRPALGQPVPHRANWLLDRKLGEGSVGEVWLGKHPKTDSRRVFKFCFDAAHIGSLKRELTLVRLLHKTLGDRPDIAKVHDIQFERSPYYLESEFTDQGDLSVWANARGGIAGIPLSTRLDLMARVCDAVAAAHSIGVLHKDLKPANILISISEDGEPRPRLSDFGIGALTDRSQLQRHNVTEAGFTETVGSEKISGFSGTRLYAPPESQVGKPFTIQGDIYALGVILYQLVVGDLKRPLAQGWEVDIEDELLRNDIARCVAGRPEDRFGSARSLSERLRTLGRRRRSRRRRRVAKLAAASSVVLFVLLVVGLLSYSTLHSAYVESDELRRTRDIVIQNAPAGIVFFNESGDCILVNPKVVEMVGGDEQKLTKQNFRELKSWKSSGMLDTMERAFRTGETQRQMAHLVSTFGEESFFDAQFVPFDRAGKQHMLLTMTDNTALRHAQHVVDILPQLLSGAGAGDLSCGDLTFPQVLARAARRVDTEFGNEDDLRATLQNALGEMYLNLGMLAEARSQLESALKVRARRFEGEPAGVANSVNKLGAEVASSLNVLGILYQQMREYENAERCFKEAIDKRIDFLGSNRIEVAESRQNLALLLLDSGRHEEAVKQFEEMLAIRRNFMGVDRLEKNATEEKRRRAEEMLLRAYELIAAQLSPSHELTIGIVKDLVVLYERWERPDDATAWRSRLP